MSTLNDSALDYYTTFPFETTRRGITGVPTFVQDQATPPLDLPFLRTLGTASLAVTAVVNTRTLQLDPGHGFVAGNTIEVADNTNGSLFMQARVLNVNVNEITVDSPINYPYTPAQTTIVRSTRSMNVDGSVTPQVFSVDPLASQKGDIVRLITSITDGSDMDFETFGGIPALTNGLVLRVNNGDGTYKNIFNFKKNGDIERYTFDSRYFTNIGAAVRGFTARMTFGGQDKHGVVLRLDGSLAESLELVVQDNLTGLLSMEWLAQGSEIQGLEDE